MGKKQPPRPAPPAAAAKPRKRGRAPASGAPRAVETPPKPTRRATWPYVLLMLVAWGVIFGGIFFSRFLSSLPDVGNLMVAGPSRDITILDDRGRLIARR